MKRTTLALILSLGLVAPGLAYAAKLTDHGHAAYKRDLSVWNGSGPSINILRLVSQRAHFEYDNIYKHDLANSPPFQHG